jgi:hypothetical protein
MASADWLQSPFAEALESLGAMMAKETGEPLEDCTEFWEQIVWNAQRSATSRAKGRAVHTTLSSDPMDIVAAEILGYLGSGDPRALKLFDDTAIILKDAVENFLRDPAGSHPRYVVATVIGWDVQDLPDDEAIRGQLDVAKMVLALVAEKMWPPAVAAPN